MRPKNLSQLEPEEVGRISTTFDEMDWAYGKPGEWGMPKARISLWSGEAGVGKSRLLAQMMTRLADMYRLKSLIVQGEVSAGQFAAEKFKGHKSELIYISEETDLETIVQGIIDVKPALVFIDSVQMIRMEKAAARAANMKPVEYVVESLRAALEVTGAHLVLISQLNKAGTTKGSTDLPHLVDIECFLKKYAPSFTRGALFEFAIHKNRYGKSGKEVIFGHQDWGVECQSDNRLKDDDWFDDSNGLSPEAEEASTIVSEAPRVIHENVERAKRAKRRKGILAWLLGSNV